ncbi:D-aminoacyl-tRNA deacylase [Mesohalobacter halotolerans]|uniref:D-aminoacyl-tRNA deacylase n=1 Tax=Mesohalobacter halotolerans TaxID=1883405 RepID=A0A4U5TSF5_9FLAO|nr:D-aminoacyl-tRNA deacylase [Mesohalobacter halotolerans]MBS3738963.1 D-tyrosyl-tRNA(Tyr) deacylase [Psychroflexus sp.]TKS56354.1 D-tyrosyl-tRNA(Tyr) deacylase [Mesohalobacter halotolerans]
MRVIIQRVKQADVKVKPEYQAEIQQGLLLFLGIEDKDTQEDVDWVVRKISRLRLFSDDAGKMNLSLLDTGFEAMVISQFTLHASIKKGNRPSFVRAAKPDFAESLYSDFIQKLSKSLGQNIKTGIFGANMEVSLLNDGPVTIFVDSKHKE